MDFTNPPDQSKRWEFYRSVHKWVQSQFTQAAIRPFLVALSAPQGAGKTTLTHALCDLAAAEGLRAQSISIDDFYLTRSDQLELARQHAANPYWQQRGYPGTHDIALGESVLSALKSGEPVRIPVYDKSAHAGQGDRRTVSEWITVPANVDLIFLEGWMLGFRSVGGKAGDREHVSAAAVSKAKADLSDSSLRAIDASLAQYDRWLRHADAFIWLEPADPRFVLEWRVEAEERMKANGKAGMSEAEIRNYIAKFMPAYETYLPGMAAGPPRGITAYAHWKIERDRLPVA